MNISRPVPGIFKRHCMVVHAHYPIGETRVEREALALSRAGIEVDVICLKAENESSYEVVNDVRIYRIPIEKRIWGGVLGQLFEYVGFFFLSWLKLLFLSGRRRYKTIQIHNLPDWLVFIAVFPKLGGAKVILDLHDLTPEFFAARFMKTTDSLLVRLMKWQEGISCRFADHVITVTEVWKDVLVNRGVPKEKIEVVMNVPDDLVFHPTSKVDENLAQDKRFLLFYHGNLTYRYGLDLAVSAVEMLSREIPMIHLYIHGWGDYRKALVDMVNRLDLKRYISFSTHGVPTSELPALINRSSICLVPYRRDVFTDGILPTKLMEYAALGKPIITVKTPAIARYFDETMVDFIAPGDVEDLANAIRRLYYHPDRMAALSSGCLQFRQRYNWTAISTKYVSLVKRLGEYQ